MKILSIFLMRYAVVQRLSHKNTTGDHLVAAIQGGHAWRITYEHPNCEISGWFIHCKTQRRVHDGQLTTREKEILDLLAGGLMYKEIASRK
ncbi:MAG: response regulator transcription factor [Bacteroidetes bacterium]|nr:response regulator transcription factor [Bacteroidota bacterium]